MFYFKIRKKAKMSSVSTQFSSVQFSCSVVSDSLWPRELQHARPPCPSPTPRVHSNSHLSSRWCHPAISSSVFPFSSCPQSLPASESFPVSQLFAWGGVITTIHYWTSSPGQCNQIRKINDMHNRKWEDSIHACMCECVLSHFSCVWFLVTPWPVAHQAPLSMGFFRQEY